MNKSSFENVLDVIDGKLKNINSILEPSIIEMKCKWVLSTSEKFWNTECNHIIFDFETYLDWKFCPWCGFPLERVENENNL